MTSPEWRPADGRRHKKSRRQKGARAAATRAALHVRACAIFGALWSANDQPVSPRFQPSSQHRPATITHGAASHRRYSSEAALNSSGRNARPARMHRATVARPARDQRATSSCPSRGQRVMVSRTMRDVVRRGAHGMREEEHRRGRRWRGCKSIEF
ncbi:hypothetical protein F511_46544 [Dorcoceras hygrometricum]|uniref:Uncharacterized protein n=1 Tax=Dorcoceras hygrometricum TaxID=472368 RepID=A0A2Z6ZTC0_9LAMI|nr:hypothetical protein F511_46544 [Dorcoceras hygrometricum]